MMEFQKLRGVITLAAAVSAVTAVRPDSPEVFASLTIPGAPKAAPAYRSIQKPLGNNLSLRIEAIRAGSEYELVVLGGQALSTGNVARLMERENYVHIINGTFFGGGRSMGDVLGMNMDGTESRLSKPFRSSNRVLREKIRHRYYFAERPDGTWEIGRRSLLVDSSGKPLPAGSKLDGYFKNYLGGLAFIDLSGKKLRQSLRAGAERSEFIRSFNAWNRNYNEMGAYDGLDGGRTRPRAALILATDDKTGEQIGITASLGTGRSPMNGLSLFSFTRQCLFAADSLNATPRSMVLLDGGKSVSYANLRDGIKIPENSTMTALGMRKISNVSMRMPERRTTMASNH